MATRTVRVTITGRVQGVGYRAWVEREASRRRLDGWVRNRRDGAVEAVVFGPDRGCRSDDRSVPDWPEGGGRDSGRHRGGVGAGGAGLQGPGD